MEWREPGTRRPGAGDGEAWWGQEGGHCTGGRAGGRAPRKVTNETLRERGRSPETRAALACPCASHGDSIVSSLSQASCPDRGLCLWPRCPRLPGQRSRGRAGVGTCSARPGAGWPRGVRLCGPSSPAALCHLWLSPHFCSFPWFLCSVSSFNCLALRPSLPGHAVTSAVTLAELVALRLFP